MRLSYRTYCCWLGYVPVSDALYLLYFSRALSDWRLLRAMAAKPGMGREKNVQFPFGGLTRGFSRTGLILRVISEVCLSNACVDINTVMTRARHLRQEAAAAIVTVVRTLGPGASFRKIMLECRRDGVIKWHRTLRKYLDLLILGGVLEKRVRNVGSVFPMELYKVKSSRAKIQVGLSVLVLHGLNWDLDQADTVWVESDLRALVRATPVKPTSPSQSAASSSRLVLAGCLEDCVAYEFKRDAMEDRGTIELLAAIIGSKRLDLPYLFERADRIGVGQSLRSLFRRVSDVFLASESETEGRSFLASRETFLKLARQYASMKIEDILNERGKGSTGLNLVANLTGTAIVNITAKQLGVTG
jgi:hypothetical protein